MHGLQQRIACISLISQLLEPTFVFAAQRPTIAHRLSAQSPKQQTSCIDLARQPCPCAL